MRRDFENRHVLLPVIHVANRDQALRNAGCAMEAGCDGFFLINHCASHDVLLEIYRSVRAAHRGAWIGLNCLDLPAEKVFATVDRDVDGIWVDNARVDERREEQVFADRVASARVVSGWQGLYFGGVAFKGQRPVEDLEQAAAVAARYMDVVTTSGPGTGHAADLEKIRRMRTGAGDVPLGIASGITVDNVQTYLPHASFFLVATGISASFTALDSQKTRELVAKVRAWRPESRPISSQPSICFVCEWNEGRSVHLELSCRARLLASGIDMDLCSAGLSQGGRVNPQRRAFLIERGVTPQEVEAHRSMVFGPRHAASELILVAELQMRDRLLARHPELEGRVMSVRGYLQGLLPDTDGLTNNEAHIEDADGHSPSEKALLYQELEELSEQVVQSIQTRMESQ